MGITACTSTNRNWIPPPCSDYLYRYQHHQNHHEYKRYYSYYYCAVVVIDQLRLDGMGVPTIYVEAGGMFRKTIHWLFGAVHKQ